MLSGSQHISILVFEGSLYVDNGPSIMSSTVLVNCSTLLCSPSSSVQSVFGPFTSAAAAMIYLFGLCGSVSNSVIRSGKCSTLLDLLVLAILNLYGV